jgi:hypothetical protein
MGLEVWRRPEKRSRSPSGSDESEKHPKNPRTEASTPPAPLNEVYDAESRKLVARSKVTSTSVAHQHPSRAQVATRALSGLSTQRTAGKEARNTSMKQAGVTLSYSVMRTSALTYRHICLATVRHLRYESRSISTRKMRNLSSVQ